jgi:hypothetical protein
MVFVAMLGAGAGSTRELMAKLGKGLILVVARRVLTNVR